MTEEKQVSLALSDARAVVNLIDILANRSGAFKGEELLAIGMLREKYKQAIEKVESKEEPEVVSE